MKKNNMITANTRKLYGVARDSAIILLASASVAFGMELFLAPNGMNAGGVLGLAQIIALYAPKYLYLGIIYVILNIPVVVLACFFFSKPFVAKTIVTLTLTGGFMMLLRLFGLAEKLGLQDFANLTLIALAGGALIAIGIALLLSAEGSVGGTDIVALMLQKKYRVANVSRFFLIFDLIVIAVYSVMLQSLTAFFYSVAALAAFQITLEFVFGSFSNAVMFEIVTDDSAAVIKAIEEELERGSTMFRAVGTYTQQTKEIVMCVVRKRQEAKARELVKKLAPNSFAYTIPIKEVIGKGFRNVNL